MKAACAAFVLAWATAALAADHAVDFLSMADLTGPPKHVSRWIGLVWAGTVNHPVQSMFYSVESGTRPRSSVDGYAVLSTAEYKRLSEFIHSYDCSNDRIYARPPYPNTIELDELVRNRSRVLCFLPRDKSCDFLSKFSALRDSDRTIRENHVLWAFWIEIGCDQGANPFHDTLRASPL